MHKFIYITTDKDQPTVINIDQITQIKPRYDNKTVIIIVDVEYPVVAAEPFHVIVELLEKAKVKIYPTEEF